MQPEFKISEDASEYPRGLVEQKLLRPSPRIFDSVSLGWSWKICIFNKFPDDAHIAGPGTTVGEFLPYVSPIALAG